MFNPITCSAAPVLGALVAAWLRQERSCQRGALRLHRVRCAALLGLHIGSHILLTGAGLLASAARGLQHHALDYGTIRCCVPFAVICMLRPLCASPPSCSLGEPYLR